MNYIIRGMRTDEYYMLDDFLYQAIYQPNKTNLVPRSIINKPELQVYIKDNLTEELDYEKIAREAAYSVFYFQRTFSALFDISVGDYIRKRRLTLAGRELNVDNSKVIEKLLKLTSDNSYIFGICYANYPHNANQFEYVIGAKCDDDCIVPDGFRINKIPARLVLCLKLLELCLTLFRNRG